MLGRQEAGGQLEAEDQVGAPSRKDHQDSICSLCQVHRCQAGQAQCRNG